MTEKLFSALTGTRRIWQVLLATAAVLIAVCASAQAATSHAKASWLGTFSTNNWSQYDGSPAFHPDGNAADFKIVTGMHPTGFTHSFEATIQSGNRSVVDGEDGERTLLELWPGTGNGHNGKTRAYQGANSWYSDYVYFPKNFQPSKNTAWNWLYQIHNYPNNDCCADLALGVVTDNEDGGHEGGERLSLQVSGGGNTAHPVGNASVIGNPAVDTKWLRGPNLVTGHWYHFVFHVRWDWRANINSGHGLVEYFIDGKNIGTYHGPTLFYYSQLHGPGQGYLSDGYYRPNNAEAGYSQPTVSVYHAGTEIGQSAASVGANGLS